MNKSLIKSSNSTPEFIRTSVLVVIGTYNRGASVVDTVKSVLKNKYLNYTVVVVDQSTNNITKEALLPFCLDYRFKYFHSSTPGLARAHNFAIRDSSAELIAITDDDCVVDENWIARFVEVFATNPKIGLVFGNTFAAPFDNSQGFIPSFVIEKPRLLSASWHPTRSRAMGACMGLRRKVWQELEGFDTTLGPGGLLLGGEDADMAIRTLLNGYYVLETPEVEVLHYGFRTFSQSRETIYRDTFGVGVVLVKPLRCGKYSVIPALLAEIILTLIPFLLKVVRLKKPFHFLQVKALFLGFWAGWKAPIDTKSGHYIEQVNEKVS